MSGNNFPARRFGDGRAAAANLPGASALAAPSSAPGAAQQAGQAQSLVPALLAGNRMPCLRLTREWITAIYWLAVRGGQVMTLPSARAPRKEYGRGDALVRAVDDISLYIGLTGNRGTLARLAGLSDLEREG